MLFVELHHMSRKPVHSTLTAPKRRIFQDCGKEKHSIHTVLTEFSRTLFCSSCLIHTDRKHEINTTSKKCVPFSTSTRIIIDQVTTVKQEDHLE